MVIFSTLRINMSYITFICLMAGDLMPVALQVGEVRGALFRYGRAPLHSSSSPPSLASKSQAHLGANARDARCFGRGWSGVVFYEKVFGGVGGVECVRDVWRRDETMRDLSTKHENIETHTPSSAS